MSHTAEVVTYKARQLKARASSSGIAAFLFAGGATSTIIWSVNGLAPWAAATGIVLSLVGTTFFGVKVPVTYRRYSITRKLNALQHDAAATLNQFPDRADHELRVASLKGKNVWARFENRLAGGVEMPEEYVTRLYEVLERVNGSALIRYSEASTAIEKASSWEEAGRIEREFMDIIELTKRVQYRYRYILLKHSEGKRLDISLEGVRQVVEQLATSPSEQLTLARRIIDELRKDKTISAEHYYRLFEAIGQLEPILTGVLISPSRRRQAELDYGLVEVEIDTYASDQVLEKLDLGRAI